MMLGITSSVNNINSVWLHSRGLWLSYLIGVLILHFVLLSLPFLTVESTWTLTNVLHNFVSAQNC